MGWQGYSTEQPSNCGEHAQACSMLAIQSYDPVHWLLITHIQEYRRQRNTITKTPQGVNVITQIY